MVKLVVDQTRRWEPKGVRLINENRNELDPTSRPIIIGENNIDKAGMFGKFVGCRWVNKDDER